MTYATFRGIILFFDDVHGLLSELDSGDYLHVAKIAGNNIFSTQVTKNPYTYLDTWSSCRTRSFLSTFSLNFTRMSLIYFRSDSMCVLTPFPLHLLAA